MKKHILFTILSSILVLTSVLAGVSFAKHHQIRPIISIESPKDHEVITEDTLDIEVHFSSQRKKRFVKDKKNKFQDLASFFKRRCRPKIKYIRLELNGEEVAVHDNKVDLKDGIHTFHLDISGLPLGEHALQAFAYQRKGNQLLEGVSPVIIFTKSDTPLPVRVIDNVIVSPDGVIVNEPTLITLTAEITPEPDLVASEITLQRLNEYNEPADFLGYLHDDGLEGDIVAGDNIYTLEIELNESEISTINLRIFAKYVTAPTPISSDIFTIDAVVPISEADFQIILDVEQEAKQKFESLREQVDDDIARRLTVIWLKRQSGVKDAGISSDGFTIWIEFTSGLEGGITTHPIGMKGSSSAAILDSPVVPGAVNAIVLAPFSDDFYPSDESDYIAQRLSQLWNPVTVIKNSAVNVNLMKTLSRYAVISISSHGSVNSEGQIQISTREKADYLNIQKHIFDLRAENFRLSIVDGYYVITPAFVKYYGNKYPKSLVYISACESIANNSMLRAFLDKGAYTYFGYDKSVYPSFAYSVGTRLFDYLLEDRMTTGEAFIALGNKIDPEPPGAKFVMDGGDDLILAEVPVVIDEHPTGEIPDKLPLIGARIFSPSIIDINLSTIKMTLDDSEIEPSIFPEEGGHDITISFTPNYELNNGGHNVTLDAKDMKGLTAESKYWEFVISNTPPIIINEMPTGETNDIGPLIQADIFSESIVDIDLSTIVMTFNGEVVEYVVTPEDGGHYITVTYLLENDLSPGEYIVTLDAKDMNGLSAEQKIWNFSIVANWQDVLDLLNDKRTLVGKEPVIVENVESIRKDGVLVIRSALEDILLDYGFVDLADALHCAGYLYDTWLNSELNIITDGDKQEIKNILYLMSIIELELKNLIKDAYNYRHFYQIEVNRVGSNFECSVYKDEEEHYYSDYPYVENLDIIAESSCPVNAPFGPSPPQLTLRTYGSSVVTFYSIEEYIDQFFDGKSGRIVSHNYILRPSTDRLNQPSQLDVWQLNGYAYTKYGRRMHGSEFPELSDLSLVQTGGEVSLTAADFSVAWGLLDSAEPMVEGHFIVAYHKFQ